MIERIKNIDKLDIEQLWSKGKIEKKEVQKMMERMKHRDL